MGIILNRDYMSYDTDSELVLSAQHGNYDSLEELILKHQSFIYNIALRMTSNTQDAEDATQEILIKMLTKLSTFQGHASFRTWLYRIVSNHVLNMKRSRRENMFQSFDMHRDFVDSIPDSNIGNEYGSDTEKLVLIEETKAMCMMGMLLCLSRKQRLVFILGSVYGVTSTVGGEIMDISPELFRKNLSRARMQLRNYMDNNCSLLNKNASCRCSRKAKAAISAGCIDPKNLQFVPDYIQKAKDYVDENLHNEKKDMSIEALFKGQPHLDSPDYTKLLHKINKIESSWESFAL